MDLLSVEDITWSFGDRLLFKDLNFKVKSGTCILLSGGNGTGKSTLFKIIHKHLICQTGQIKVMSKNIKSIENWKLELMSPMADQTPIIDSKATIAENLIGLEQDNNNFGWSYLFSPKSKSIQNLEPTYEELAELVGLDADIHSIAGNLSYGQKRLLTIIRALWPSMFHEKKVVLLDEPLAGISKKNMKKVLGAIEHYCKQGWGFLIIEHTPIVRNYIDQEINIEDYAK